MALPPPHSRRRVIVNTDAKNEADDQFAIVHALLTPMFDLRGIVPAHFGTERSQRSMEDSREEVDHLLGLMGLEGTVTIADGAPHALPDESTPVDSPGARLIIEEAHRDEGTLYVAFLGPLTDMASALLLDPTIADRDVVVVWIGGPPYGDTLPAYDREFNLRNDVHSANVVIASGVQVWQVPMSTYVMMGVSYAEMLEKVAPCGELGAYLVSEVMKFNASHHGGPVEYRSLGDTPAIGLMMSPGSAVWREQAPVRFTAECGYEPADAGRPIRVAEIVDSRYMLEDFFAKLRDFTAAPHPSRSHDAASRTPITGGKP
jgi:purine nucleosidase